MNLFDENVTPGDDGISSFDVSDTDTVEYISKEGHQKLVSELSRLRSQERLRIAERLEYAKSLGDLSENAEFDTAKQDQMLNEIRIRELEDFLRRATIVEKNSSQSTVGIGSRVEIHLSGAIPKMREQYTIVGSSEEINPVTGAISHESPLGKALWGRRKGEKVKVITPKGQFEYVIVEIT